jgi:hypothetical protein
MCCNSPKWCYYTGQAEGSESKKSKIDDLDYRHNDGFKLISREGYEAIIFVQYFDLTYFGPWIGKAMIGGGSGAMHFVKGPVAQTAQEASQPTSQLLPVVPQDLYHLQYEVQYVPPPLLNVRVCTII